MRQTPQAGFSLIAVILIALLLTLSTFAASRALSYVFKGVVSSRYVSDRDRVFLHLQDPHYLASLLAYTLTSSAPPSSGSPAYSDYVSLNQCLSLGSGAIDCSTQNADGSPTTFVNTRLIESTGDDALAPQVLPQGQFYVLYSLTGQRCPKGLPTPSCPYIATANIQVRCPLSPTGNPQGSCAQAEKFLVTISLSQANGTEGTGSLGTPLNRIATTEVLVRDINAGGSTLLCQSNQVFQGYNPDGTAKCASLISLSALSPFNGQNVCPSGTTLAGVDFSSGRIACRDGSGNLAYVP